MSDEEGDATPDAPRPVLCFWCGSEIPDPLEYCPACNTKRQDLPLP